MVRLAREFASTDALLDLMDCLSELRLSSRSLVLDRAFSQANTNIMMIIMMAAAMMPSTMMIGLQYISAITYGSKRYKWTVIYKEITFNKCDGDVCEGIDKKYSLYQFIFITHEQKYFFFLRVPKVKTILISNKRIPAHHYFTFYKICTDN